MKKVVVFLMVCLVIVCSCGPRPAYKTASGKKKLKHYNRLQYGGGNNTVMRAN
jgi:hypothetical protein